MNIDEQQETEDVQPTFPNLAIPMPDYRKKAQITKGILVGRFLYGDLGSKVTALRAHLSLNKVPFETFLLAVCAKTCYSEETPYDIYQDIFGVSINDIPEEIPFCQDIETALDQIAWWFMMKAG